MTTPRIVRISDIRTWDHIENTDWRFGCELWFGIPKINTPGYKTTHEFDDTRDEIRVYLNGIGKQGVDWIVEKFNSRMIIHFQRKGDWLAFLLVFK